MQNLPKIIEKSENCEILVKHLVMFFNGHINWYFQDLFPLYLKKKKKVFKFKRKEEFVLRKEREKRKEENIFY